MENRLKVKRAEAGQLVRRLPGKMEECGKSNFGRKTKTRGFHTQLDEGPETP